MEAYEEGWYCLVMAEGTSLVIVELPCVQCAYNLRTQPATGVCPECGSPIEVSLRDTIFRAGPRYLRRLGRCAAWVAITAMALPMGYFVAVLVEIFFFRMGGPGGRRAMEIFQLVTQGLMLAILAVHAVAVWIISVRTPGRRTFLLDVLMRVGVSMFMGMFGVLLVRSVVNVLETFAMDTMVSILFLTRFLRYLDYLLPLFMFGLAIYPIAGAFRLAGIYARAGLSSRIFLPKWSLILFGVCWCIIASVISIIFLINILEISVLGPFELILEIAILLAAGVALLSLIGVVVGLFKFRNRMRELVAICPASGAPLTGATATEDAPTL